LRYNLNITYFPYVKVFFLEEAIHSSWYQVLHSWQQIQPHLLTDFSHSNSVNKIHIYIYLTEST
jgi:hypothetical protein